VFVVVAFLAALRSLLTLIITAYMIVIVARAVISWIPTMDPWHPFVRLTVNLTEPVLGRVRKYVGKVIPLHKIGIDITPMLVIFALFFINDLVNSLIIGLIEQLKG
jgi:YggT family protein